MTPAPLAQITLQSGNYTIEHYTMAIRSHDEFDLTADYQRGSVWTLEQRQALIRSIIIGLPIGSVTIAEQPYTAERIYRVVDGKQRIETLRAFIDEQSFGVPAHWFTVRQLVNPALRDVPGAEARWDDLTARGKGAITRRSLPAITFVGYEEIVYDENGEMVQGPKGGALRRTLTAEEALRREAEMFVLLNGGGTAQTAEHLALVAAMA